MLKISRGWFERTLKPRLFHQSFNYLGPGISRYYVFETQLSSTIELTPDFRENYHGKGRNEVSRAIKQGVNFETIEYEEFLKLNKVWATAKKLKPANKIYLSTNYEMFCTKTYLGSVYLSAHAYILSTDVMTARLLYSVTNLDENRTLVGLANRFNHDKDFELLLTREFRLVDLGGLGPETPGINSFKRSFGGRDVVNINAYSCLLYLYKKFYRI